MRSPAPQFRFRAVSMELAVQLEEHRVDMLVVTEDGTTVAIECENDAISKIAQHIAAISHHCPEIARWGTPVGSAPAAADDTGYQAAPSGECAPPAHA